MPLSMAEKTEIIEEFAQHPGDTGSPEVQIASCRIIYANISMTKAHGVVCSSSLVNGVAC